MFTDEFLEKIFANDEARKCPIGTQSTMVHVFEDIVERMVEEDANAKLSELLTTMPTKFL